MVIDERSHPMTTTPDNGATQPLAAGQHPQNQATQPLPPVGATRPHPTNPFTPPHPAAPADQRAAYEAAQRAGQDPATPHGPGTTPPGEVPARRERSIWLPVTGAAAAAAILAAIATAGITHTLSDGDASNDRPASLATIGREDNDSVPVAGSTAENPNWEAVADAVQESVVAIQVSDGNGSGSQGSGVIVDEDGHIVTNNHVVAGADGQVQVTLTDGRLFQADVIGTDPTTDLAVIKLTDAPDDLTPAELGDSSEVAVGQPVMAVGNPLGLANTVTTGIVSAVDRPVSTSGDSADEAIVTNAIQIDAAVNPGNSGGPLFDAEGLVIGINSSIATLSSQSGSIGLGFAIPVDLVKNIATQLIEDGTAEHAFLGVGLSDGTATADGVTRHGAVVESVSDGSPAADAGLQVGDTIVAIDDQAVGGAESLTAYVRELVSGAKSTLTVVRDGRTTEVDVTLAVRPETTTQQPQEGQGNSQDQRGGVPEGLSPEEMWEWFQQQGGGQG
ncbi:trypsin-like peptidase domain-containing protein [Cellulomonas sp. zg-ZUI168]|nr:trypsin-like peptidase domain-containing protein [Cellulomonas fengjieae]